jgi:hypothetical protein
MGLPRIHRDPGSAPSEALIVMSEVGVETGRERAAGADDHRVKFRARQWCSTSEGVCVFCVKWFQDEEYARSRVDTRWVGLVVTLCWAARSR